MLITSFLTPRADGRHDVATAAGAQQYAFRHVCLRRCDTRLFAMLMWHFN